MVLLAVLASARADVKVVSADRSRTDCVSGDVVGLSVDVRADEPYTTVWEAPAELTEGFTPLSAEAGDEVDLTCPPCPPGEDGMEYPFRVTVTGDETGDVDFGLVTMPLSCEDHGEEKGCSLGAAPAAAGSLGVVVLGLLRRRRRRL